MKSNDLRSNHKTLWLLSAVILMAFASSANGSVPRTVFVEESAYSLGNFFFMDTLALNQSKTISVRANEPYNYTGIQAIEGQKYRFTVSSPGWNNGLTETDAGGYNYTGSYAWTRRHQDYKMMALVVEFYAVDRRPSAYTGRKALIGLGPREWKANVTGYMVAIANDCLACYADNSRVVTLTIKRISAD